MGNEWILGLRFALGGYLEFFGKLSGLPEPRRHFIGGGKVDDADAADLRVGADFGDGFVGRLAVEVKNGDGLAAGHLPAHGHLGDVDPVLAENRADEADQPGHIPMRENQHDAIHETIEMIGT